MDRRDALKALASIAGAAGMTVTPITERQAERAALLVIRTERRLTMEQIERFKAEWHRCLVGTPLEGVRMAVLEGGTTLELVTK